VHAAILTVKQRLANEEKRTVSWREDLRPPHSPDERLEIASGGKVYDLLVATLKRIPARCVNASS
jgi:hypothetical protein